MSNTDEIFFDTPRASAAECYKWVDNGIDPATLRHPAQQAVSGEVLVEETSSATPEEPVVTD